MKGAGGRHEGRRASTAGTGDGREKLKVRGVAGAKGDGAYLTSGKPWLLF